MNQLRIIFRSANYFFIRSDFDVLRSGNAFTRLWMVFQWFGESQHNLNCCSWIRFDYENIQFQFLAAWCRYTQERCNADLPSKLCHSGRFIFCKTGIIILKNIRLPKHKQILQCFIVPLICQTALTLLITVESAWSRPEWLKFSITLYCC